MARARRRRRRRRRSSSPASPNPPPPRPPPPPARLRWCPIASARGLPHRTIRRGSRRDPAVVASFLSDAAHVPGGFAAGVATPRNEAEVAALVAAADRVLPVGAQSSLTGGATPRGELVLSTRALSCHRAASNAPCGSGRACRWPRSSVGWPPRALLPSRPHLRRRVRRRHHRDQRRRRGHVQVRIDPRMGRRRSPSSWRAEKSSTSGADEVTASRDGWFEHRITAGHSRAGAGTRRTRCPLSRSCRPDTSRAPGMDLIDLFIGSEGTLGIVVDAELRLVPRPRRLVALVRCDGDAQADRARPESFATAAHAACSRLGCVRGLGDRVHGRQGASRRARRGLRTRAGPSPGGRFGAAAGPGRGRTQTTRRRSTGFTPRWRPPV